jgi:hypothetical protein
MENVTRMHNNGGLSVVRTREAVRGAQYDDDGGQREPRANGVVKTG